MQRATPSGARRTCATMPSTCWNREFARSSSLTAASVSRAYCTVRSNSRSASGRLLAISQQRRSTTVSRAAAIPSRNRSTHPIRSVTGIEGQAPRPLPQAAAAAESASSASASPRRGEEPRGVGRPPSRTGETTS